jgi:hypothetical protein
VKIFGKFAPKRLNIEVHVVADSLCKEEIGVIEWIGDVVCKSASPLAANFTYSLLMH